MKRFTGLLVLALLLSMYGCKKDEEIIIKGNNPPPDPTVTDVTMDVIKENYVNKVYISLLGRKPDSVEFNQGLVILNQNDLSIADREQLLDVVLNGSEYDARIYDLARSELLNNLDTADITTEIFIYNLLLQDTVTYGAFFPQIKLEIQRLEELQRVPQDLASDSIDIIGLHRRCVNNSFYDEINMGTENFVVSMFQNFLLRYPTQTELTQASLIVDGFTGTIFYQVGASKSEFLDIFFGASDYFEGQVRNLFIRYLFTEPSSEQMSSLANTYKQNLDYKVLQKSILTMDEYVGLK